MNTIKESSSFEQIINKSQFICTLYPVTTVEEIQDILNKTRKTYYNANHNCYSYILGNNGEIAKNSDDGEPSQTAGVVIYEVLKKNELTNVLAIVTRYFGGIKLGAGGLIRAYGSSTSGALKKAKILKIEKCIIMKLTFSYQLLNTVNKLIGDFELINKVFENEISLDILLPSSEKDSLIKNLVSSTKNTIKIQILDEITKAM